MQSLSPALLDRLKFYRRNGYSIIEDVLLKEECEKVISVYEKFADEAFSPIMNLHWYAKDVLDIVEHPRIVAIVDAFSDTKVESTHTHFNFKKAGTPFHEQPWNEHQDNTYPRAQWGQYITVGVALTDQDQENGAVFVYPGSHVEPLLEAEPTPTFRENAAVGNKVIVPRDYLDSKTVCTMKQGSIMVLHGNTIHGSFPNVSKRDRPILLMTYLPPNIDFIEGKNGQRRRIALRRWPIFSDHNMKERFEAAIARSKSDIAP